jgi:hypothetical protein
MNLEFVVTEQTACVACESEPGTVLIRTRADIVVSICSRCWLTILDEDRVAPRV